MSENGDGTRAELPRGWVEKAAGEILTFEYGKGLPARSRAGGEVAVYASSGRVGAHNEALVNEDVIVVGRKGAAGRAFLAEGPAWIIDTAYYAVSPEEHDIRFLTYQLQAAELSRLDQSTAIPSLSRDDLRTVPLWLPPLEEQRLIVERIEALRGGISAGDAVIARAEDGLRALQRSTLGAAMAAAIERAATEWPAIVRRWRGEE